MGKITPNGYSRFLSVSLRSSDPVPKVGVAVDAKFKPNQETLPDVSTLYALSAVSLADIDNAILSWQHKPPDTEFTNLLDAS